MTREQPPRDAQASAGDGVVKTLLRVFSTIHALMALLFAAAALILIYIAARTGWTVLANGLDQAAAQGLIEAVGLLAAAVVALQIARRSPRKR